MTHKGLVQMLLASPSSIVEEFIAWPRLLLSDVVARDCIFVACWSDGEVLGVFRCRFPTPNISRTSPNIEIIMPEMAVIFRPIGLQALTAHSSCVQIR
jgi:hypothetical protein